MGRAVLSVFAARNKWSLTPCTSIPLRRRVTMANYNRLTRVDNSILFWEQPDTNSIVLRSKGPRCPGLAHFADAHLATSAVRPFRKHWVTHPLALSSALWYRGRHAVCECRLVLGSEGVDMTPQCVTMTPVWVTRWCQRMGVIGGLPI